MAPPTPIHTRAEIQSLYAEQLKNPEKYNCSLKQLYQNECTYRLLENGTEYICVPFKRLFQRCLVPTTKTVNGRKVRGESWINIEITDAKTNESRRKTYGSEMDMFREAEKEALKWMEELTEN